MHDPAERGLAWQLVGIQVAVLLLVVALTPASALFPNEGDVLLYFQDGQRVLAGLIPYRDFPFEYPPLALLPMILPQLLWPFPKLTFETFEWLFLLQNAVLAAATGVTVAWVARRTADRDLPVARALATWALLVIAAAPFVSWRFDIFPALLSMLAVALALAGRPRLAGISLGIGVAAKLFPAVLGPVILAWYLAERRWRDALGFAAACTFVVVLAVLPFVALGLKEPWPYLDYQQARPLQIESVLAGVVLLQHLVTATPVEVVHNFGSVGISSPLADSLTGRLTIVAAVAFLALLAAACLRFVQERRAEGKVRPATFLAYLAAGMLLLLVGDKVFSVQYMVWILPFAPLFTPRQTLAVVLACALSFLIHPLNYDGLMALQPGMILVLNARNLLVLAVLVRLVDQHMPDLGALGPASRQNDLSRAPASKA